MVASTFTVTSLLTLLVWQQTISQGSSIGFASEEKSNSKKSDEKVEDEGEDKDNKTETTKEVEGLDPPKFSAVFLDKPSSIDCLFLGFYSSIHF